MVAVDYQREAVDGVVLAGGQARRFGGCDKGLLPLAGEALAARAATRLRSQTARVIIVANRNQEDYARFGDAVVGDVIGGFAGPLAGIHAGMSAAVGNWVLSVPCDSPFFPNDLAKRLFAAIAATKADVAVSVAASRTQPVFMLARTELRDDLAAFIAAGDSKVERWYKRLRYTEAIFADAEAFENINTPEELSAAAVKITRSG